MPDKKYQVANPRGLPEDTRILVTEGGKEFREGDAIDVDDVKDGKDFADLVKRGFVVEVKESRRRGRATAEDEPVAEEEATEPEEVTDAD